MSKYSIVNRRYVLNATKAEKSRKEMEKLIHQTHEFKSYRSEVPATSHNLNDKKVKNYFHSKIFGDKVKEVHSKFNSQRSKSGSSSS